MSFPALDTSRIVAIVCAFALLGAWIFGIASLPDRRGGAQGSNLAAIQPFAPQPGYIGSHVFGLWTLTCGSEPKQPQAAGIDTPRCRTQGLVNARRTDGKVIPIVAIRVVRAGPENKPYLVIYLPSKSQGDGTMLFAIDGNNAFRAPIKVCGGNTCKVEAPMPDVALSQMLAGKTLKLQLGGPPPAPADKIVYPLHGFRESFEAMSAAEPPV